MRTTALMTAIVCIGLNGCRSGAGANAPGSEQAGEPAARGEPADFAAQAERGAPLYAQHCAMCHGEDGRGTDQAPPVVGPAAFPREPHPAQTLREEAFETAGDVFEFVARHMPLDAPGSLTEEEYAAILAFALQQSGVEPDRPLTAETAQRIRLDRDRPAAGR